MKELLSYVCGTCMLMDGWFAKENERERERGIESELISTGRVLLTNSLISH